MPGRRVRADGSGQAADDEERDVVLERIRSDSLKRRFGITPEKYDEMLEAQGGVCAICFREPDPGRRLAVDHDHACCPDRYRTCGRCIRALLCTSCNNRLGIVEDAEWMGKARMYLGAHASQAHVTHEEVA